MRSFINFIRTTKKVFKTYLQIAPKLTLGILFTQIILSLQGTANAYIFARIIDLLVKFVANKTASFSDVFPLVILFASLNLFASLIGLVNAYLNALLSNIDVVRLKLLQTDHLVSLGISQLEDANLTNKSTRYTEVYSTMSQHLSILVSLLSLLFIVIVNGVIVTSIIPIFTVCFVALFIYKYSNNSKFMKKVWDLSRENTEWRRNAWTSVGYLADPASLKEILLSGGVSFLKTKFMKFIHFYESEYKNVRTKWFMYELLQTTLDVVLFSAALYFIITKSIVSGVSLGLLTFYIRSISSFADQIDTLSYRVARAIESSIRVEDALELFDIYKPETDGNALLPKTKVPPLISLKDISFTYQNGNRPVINKLNLTIRPSEKIAIVGENGAGKTTLVKLLTRIYKPQIGSITIDGVDLNKVKVDSWHQNLGVLFQDFNSYGNLTVTENIEIGKANSRKFSKKLILKAIKKADALDFVLKYPLKLDQILSERYKGGIRPSGGQWQKLAIARFFYRNAPVLILDEPTASIDAVSEAKIFDNVYKFMKGKTVIIISHRFSTVRNADRILVLDKGRIIEEGSHAELMKLKGKYAHAFNLQAKGYS